MGREFVPEHLADASQRSASKDQDPASVLVDDGSLSKLKSAYSAVQIASLSQFICTY